MIQAIRGTKDILPSEIENWYFLENIFRSVSDTFGYKELKTPIFEKTEVFSRGIGDGTDIVNKEMYTFDDRGGESLTLRPEATAALVRSVIQNKLANAGTAQKFWYFGPFFRYERPQKGRLRQFHQYGAECLATDKPESDVEVILLANSIIKKAGISDYKLLLNSLGNDSSRAEYRKALIEYLENKKEQLSEDSQSRLQINPLRVLDSKDKRDIDIVKDAPILSNYFDEESKNHFTIVTSMLDNLGVQYEISPKLVRGLDYYSHTVFEFQSSALGAQDSFGGGGRYNKLFSELGGKDTPAVGFAFGVERLLLILEELKLLPEAKTDCDIFIVAAGDGIQNYSFKIAQELRDSGLRVAVDLNDRSMKAQMRASNKSGAIFTILIGEDELNNNTVTIKNMGDSTQVNIAYNELSNFTFNIA